MRGVHLVRLKKIELHGFKSFADKTVLHFDEGLTAIVGPNGCGKSNVSDAFRWVLGEQSAKSLRGGKMHDVIFAGTTSRHAMNYAEVTLTFTDVGDALPVEYDEVAVTRRLHRSGESEYLLNRNPVRLRDIKSLFIDAIGKIAIFEQGNIEKVINLSPTERRRIFEEAASILRFLESKRDALRRLDKTDGNMVRVRDIYGEIEKQMHTSKEQAEHAKRYKEQVTALDLLEKSLCLAKFERLAERVESSEEKSQQVDEAIRDAHGLVLLLTLQLEENKELLEREEGTFRQRSEKVYQARSSREIQTKERQVNQQRLQEAQGKAKKFEKEIQELRKKRENEQVTAAHSQQRQKKLEKDLMLQKEALDAIASQARKQGQQLDQLRGGQQKAQQECMVLIQEESRAEALLKENRVRLEGAEEKKKELELRHREGASRDLELKEDLGKKEKVLEEISEEILQRRHTLEELEHALEKLGVELRIKSEERELLASESAELATRQKVLLRLKEDMEGYSAGTKALMREGKDEKSPLQGKLRPLSEMVSAQEGYETALATVMRPYMQTLVVETKEDLKACLAFSQELGLKDYSLLCLETVAELSGQSLTEQALCHSLAGGSLAHHFSGQVGVLQEGQELVSCLGNGIWVDCDGTLADGQGVLFVTSQGANNAFLREAELKGLEKRLAEVEKTLQTVSQAKELLQRKKVALDVERSELDQVIRRQEMKQVEANFGVQRGRSDLKEHGTLFAKVSVELEKVKSLVTELSQSIEELLARHQELQVKAREKSQHLEQLEKQLKEVVETHHGVEGERQEQDLAYRKGYEEYQELCQTLKVLSVREEEGFQKEERLQEEVEALEKIQEEVKAKEQEAGSQLEGVEKELEGVEEECVQLEALVKKRKARITHVEANLQAARALAHQVEEEKHQWGMKLAQLQSQLEAVRTDLLERHQLTVEEARGKKLALEGSIEESEKRVRSLRRSIDQAGDVNMKAIEAYEEQKERHRHLEKQIGDMEGSKKELLQIISELDGETRKLFKETFTKIRENFQKNFRILFNGGEADLTFTESQDVLEAGIEIIAKPPGKKMRSIQLLSGGEKCLTAMALLFAIFEVKPSPFCVLDEIDAPLDDSNIERFVNVVKQFIDKSQFIIITHNKRTMAVADVIYGVSMEERGVSKLLSMKFSEAAKEQELVSVHT